MSIQSIANDILEASNISKLTNSEPMGYEILHNEPSYYNNVGCYGIFPYDEKPDIRPSSLIFIHDDEMNNIVVGFVLGVDEFNKKGSSWANLYFENMKPIEPFYIEFIPAITLNTKYNSEGETVITDITIWIDRSIVNMVPKVYIPAKTIINMICTDTVSLYDRILRIIKTCVYLKYSQREEVQQFLNESAPSLKRWKQIANSIWN